MLHISCDHCGKTLETGDTHFVVRIEVFAAQEPAPLTEDDLDADHMEAVGQLLEQMEEDGEEVFTPETRQFRYDLCPDCRTRYLRDPLGKESGQKLGFSAN
jgi:hypothetical protein